MISISAWIDSSRAAASLSRPSRRNDMYSQWDVAVSMSGLFEKRMHSPYAAAACSKSPFR